MTKRNFMAKELSKPNYRQRIVPQGKDKYDDRTIDIEEYLTNKELDNCEWIRSDHDDT